eukprot:UN32346
MRDKLLSGVEGSTDSKYCGKQIDYNGIELEKFLNKTFGLFVVSGETPLSLGHSLVSWEEYGLLELTNERLIWLNGNNTMETQLAEQYDFKILRPTDIPDMVPWSSNVPGGWPEGTAKEKEPVL